MQVEKEQPNAALFSREEHLRYARHTMLPGFGLSAQEKLKRASILVIGAGGLGAPLLQYLCAAGVGRIGIIDPDTVSLSNLQRQVLYSVDDLGMPKASTAAQKLKAQNPHVAFEVFPFALHRDNALDVLASFDLVADGSDNFPTRYLVNDACVLLGKPLVYGSVFRFEGQVSVFNWLHSDGRRGPNYRNLYPEPPPPGTVPSCAEGGVLGVLPGIIGSMQANEAIKILSHVGTPLSGTVCVYDALSARTHLIRIPEQEPYPVYALEDYEQLCGLPGREVPEIAYATLQSWVRSASPFHLVDVREPEEYARYNIGGELIPLARLAPHLPSLPRHCPIVFVCQSGKRSMQAALLAMSSDLAEVYSLKGGVEQVREGYFVE
ncbi:MAG: molybdopterin-synthase adenylyltransferase MoeB [Haliscomenobacter sp.]